jgi:hypothetical protein
VIDKPARQTLGFDFFQAAAVILTAAMRIRDNPLLGAASLGIRKG